MSMNNEDIVDTLNDLLETSMDGELGFSNSAKYVESPSLRQVFSNRAQDCQCAAEELRTQIIALGGKPHEGGSGSGKLHLTLLKMRGKLSGHSDAAMLEECERGEDVAKARYRKALEKSLPRDIQLLVQRQYEGALKNHDQIRLLRDEFTHHA